MAGVLADTSIVVLAIRSRSGNGRRDTSWRGVGADVQTVRDIEPDAPVNASFFFALELSQASPQSTCVKDFA